LSGFFVGVYSASERIWGATVNMDGHRQEKIWRNVVDCFRRLFGRCEWHRVLISAINNKRYWVAAYPFYLFILNIHKIIKKTVDRLFFALYTD